MVVIIRPYQPDDLENTVQLWYQTWHETFPYIQPSQPYTAWKHRLRDQFTVYGEIWVAEIEQQIVGFMVVIKQEQMLSQLFVAKSYQNQGIGSQLLEKAKAICPQGLKLQTLQANVQACAFYERHKFQFAQMSINKINGQPNVEYYWMPESISENR